MPLPLFRRHSPGAVAEGGTLADGTRILHCIYADHYWYVYVSEDARAYLVEVLI